MNDSNARLTDLEIKISFAEDLLDELNRTIYRQQQQIEQLMTQMNALREQVRSGDSDEQSSLRDEIPPHY